MMNAYPTATAMVNLCANDDLDGARQLVDAYLEDGGDPGELMFGLVQAALAVHYWTHTQAHGQPPTPDQARQLLQALAHTSLMATE